jgi:hypothetical protein
VIRRLSIAALAVAVVLVAPAYAYGQVVTAPVSIPATVATKADVAAVQAQIPQIADTVPAADMAIGGAVGSSNLVRRNDAQAPRITRSISGTSGGTTGGATATDGTVAVTWAAMPSVPKLNITVYTTLAQANKPTCSPITGTVTTTGATIRCVRQGSVLGLGLLPADVNVAGVYFDIIVLPAS